MPNEASTFYKKSSQKAHDEKHRNTIEYNISKYTDAVERGKKNYTNLEEAKKLAASIKADAINNLDKYLIEFERNFTLRGGKIIWANDTQQALENIIKILKQCNAKTIVKSKSMTTEEINFNEALFEKKIKSVETDLGEFIVQLADEKPYHIVTPVMHKSKTDVAELFHKKFNTPINSTPEDITQYVRDTLRQIFQTAEVGITGANFIVADCGGIALTENEGNALMTTAFPKTHIAICGIEKVIPSLNHLSLMWPILAHHGTGQKITTYNSVFFGPRQENETDGPDEMYVILLDNKRTKLLNTHPQREALKCIRCGSCLNVCPVYKTIGGHTYNSAYVGPIGAIITPFYYDFKKFQHLSFSSTLCGRCSENCPVKIDIHNLLLYNRNLSVTSNYRTIIEKNAIKILTTFLLKRKWMDFINGSIKNIFLKLFIKSYWGSRRKLPRFSKKSYSQQYIMKNK